MGSIPPVDAFFKLSWTAQPPPGRSQRAPAAGEWCPSPANAEDPCGADHGFSGREMTSPAPGACSARRFHRHAAPNPQLEVRPRKALPGAMMKSEAKQYNA